VGVMEKCVRGGWGEGQLVGVVGVFHGGWRRG